MVIHFPELAWDQMLGVPNREQTEYGASGPRLRLAWSPLRIREVETKTNCRLANQAVAER